MNDLDDTELLRRVAAKDLEAFEILVGRYQGRVLGLCSRLLHDPRHAEDVAQEVFFRIYQAAGKFREASLVSTWIYRIVFNRCRNFNRDNWKFLPPGEARFGREEGRENGREPAADAGDDPAAAWALAETREIIRKAVAGLPEKQKRVLILHKLEGRSYKEIAGILGISLSSVESSLHRAKRSLQKRLGPEFAELGAKRKFPPRARV